MAKFLRRVVTVVLLFASVLPAVAGRAAEFLAALEDVPVMPGFSEDTAAAVSFDTAAGRIVTARIAGPSRPGVDAGALLAFYAATLPALGWRAETPTRFVRDGEVLTLRTEAGEGRLALGFELRPN